MTLVDETEVDEEKVRRTALEEELIDLTVVALTRVRGQAATEEGDTLQRRPRFGVLLNAAWAWVRPRPGEEDDAPARKRVEALRTTAVLGGIAACEALVKAPFLNPPPGA